MRIASLLALRDDQLTDIEEALLWQYNEAERLEYLVKRKQAWNTENNIGFWLSWVQDYFNLQTATINGLAVWSIILNLPLYFNQSSSSPDYPAFGFADYLPPFYESNFATTFTGISGLSTDDRRTILRIRYYQLVTRGTVTDINAMLKDVFGAGAAYVVDNFDMTMTYVFNIQPSSNLVLFFETYDILPRPAGVKMNIAYGLAYSFGFASYQPNFNSSNFVGELAP